MKRLWIALAVITTTVAAAAFTPAGHSFIAGFMGWPPPFEFDPATARPVDAPQPQLVVAPAAAPADDQIARINADLARDRQVEEDARVQARALVDELKKP